MLNLVILSHKNMYNFFSIQPILKLSTHLGYVKYKFKIKNITITNT